MDEEVIDELLGNVGSKGVEACKEFRVNPSCRASPGTRLISG